MRKTALREAFERARVTPAAERRFVNRILRVMERGAGVYTPRRPTAKRK